MSRLLAFLENQELEAAEKKKAEQEKKRQEEEKQRLEEAKLRAEAEKRRAQAIMEATAAQAFAKLMATLEEKIKGHVQSTLTASEEKRAKLHDNLQRFLERVDSEGLKRPRIDAYPGTRGRLELDDYEREADTEGRGAATPVTKKRTVMARKAKEPMVVEEKKKGAVASSSRAGVIEFVLELRESMQAKQAPELKQMCKRSNIRWVSKAQAIKDLVAAETRLAYDGWLTGAERQGKRHYSLAELLEDAYAAGKTTVEFETSGDKVWGEKWSIVRRKFGTSTVAGEGAKLPLGRSKLLLEEGGMFRVAPIVLTENARCRGKGYLRLLLELPRKRAELKYFDVSKLVFLYRCAREFKTKTSRRILKEMIAAVIRKKTGVNIRLKINVGLKYSHRLRKRKIHDTVVLCVEKSIIHPVLQTMLRCRVRVVWKKNTTAEQILANHRKVASEATALCTCSQDLLPRMEGHVLARIADYSAATPFLHNGKNVLQSESNTRPMDVQKAVKRSLEVVMRRDLYRLADRMQFREIVSERAEERPACSEKQAWELATKLSHLVVVPVDRNQGDLVIMCPSTYHHGLQLMFNLNVAYQQVPGVFEKEALARVRTELKGRNLEKLGAWNPKAKLGRAYVLPKHKDLLRWRPIAPTNAEGSKTAGRRLARALNFLLKRVPKARHFNLKATALL
ncbi:hypothetical protein CBR_g45345 [Chara braunii]|uniref:Uncharacterized protein n=1 Tax=Chara braunii TaxID=69332 RepID=A0A388LYA3_CHABU|nr:hypothetical protein CBR_g45345 [Chara braunii]|eukprot:GBG87286.1 hypothetical protein CBR_g45345 [Chara braunii]